MLFFLGESAEFGADFQRGCVLRKSEERLSCNKFSRKGKYRKSGRRKIEQCI